MGKCLQTFPAKKPCMENKTNINTGEQWRDDRVDISTPTQAFQPYYEVKQW